MTMSEAIEELAETTRAAFAVLEVKRPASCQRAWKTSSGRQRVATPVTVDPSTTDQVESVDPPGAVVAVVDLGAIRLSGLEQVDALICSQRPFFASAEAGSEWLARHPGGRIFRFSFLVP